MFPSMYLGSVAMILTGVLGHGHDTIVYLGLKLYLSLD